jgi:hypothetical protein
MCINKKKLASPYSVREVVHVARDVDHSALYSTRRRGGDELGHQLVDEEEVPEVVHREMNFTFFGGELVRLCTKRGAVRLIARTSYGNTKKLSPVG